MTLKTAKEVNGCNADLRDVVLDFAEMMEHVLRIHDHKGGWGDGLHPLWALAKMGEEFGELSKALALLHQTDGRPYLDYEAHNRIVANAIRECVDIANVSMMMADVLSLRYVGDPISAEQEIDHSSGEAR